MKINDLSTVTEEVVETARSRSSPMNHLLAAVATPRTVTYDCTVYLMAPGFGRQGGDERDGRTAPHWWVGDSCGYDHTACAGVPAGPCAADPVALAMYLASLDAQVRALRTVTMVADPGTRRILATLTVRAQALIATALVLAGDILGQGTDIIPPL